jgi:ABC-type phosphate/phosphonate transport system ATPase subunit
MINNAASDVRTIGEQKFTVEMNDIVDTTQAGLSLKCIAYAGAGKSTLLRSIEKYHSKKYGLYIILQ